MVSVEAFAKSDIGRKRKNNEDNYLLGKEINLYAVADGMGGHKAGEIASMIVVETIQARMTEYLNGTRYPNYYDTSAVSGEAAMLLSSFEEANYAVFNEAKNSPDCRGMGSTVSAVFFAENSFVAANVGDSPVFWIHKGEISRVYVPHIYNKDKPENSAFDEQKRSHVLTRSMGVRAEVEPSFFEVPCFRNDYIVIASDGLTDKVNINEIRDIVISKKPEKACAVLVETANERGGDDNITVLVLRVKKVRKKWSFWGLF